MISALNQAREVETTIMKSFVQRTRENNLNDLAIIQGKDEVRVSKPAKFFKKKKVAANSTLSPKMNYIFRNNFLTSFDDLKRQKYKPFLSLRKPSLQRQKRVELLRLLLKHKQHPHMQIDYKNLIAVYVKELETHEVKYPFQFSFKE